MPRRTRSPKLETRTNRLKLAMRRKPYFVVVSPGISLGYRRNRGPGTWVLRCADGHGRSWTKAFATVDDHEDADATHVLDYWQAQDRARDLARGRETDASRPATLAEALDDYERSLAATGGATANATRVRYHLTPALLSKPVALLTARELKGWRDGLVAKGTRPATVTRTAKVLRACLNFAADHDPRITNRSAWKVGLSGLVDTNVARHVPLTDDQVRAVVAAGCELDQSFGLYLETHATTGARSSQIAALEVGDLRGDRLLMPSSRKGRGRRQIERKPVPIPPGLAQRLQQAAGDRPATDRLLLRSDAQPWNPVRADHAALYKAAAAAAGVKGTIYALRHSSIIRSLVAGVPVRIVAALHDTSTIVLERTYSAFVLDHADTVARRGLLDVSGPGPENVVPIGRRS
jgi:integrase